MTETKGYFGQFGGSFVPEPIQNLLNQLEATFEQYKMIQNLSQNTNIIWKTILDAKHRSTLRKVWQNI